MAPAQTDFKTYYSGLSVPEREALATACDTSTGHLANIAYGCKPCAPALAIKIERESAGKVTCESLCPEVDWAYIRGTKRARPAARAVGA